MEAHVLASGSKGNACLFKFGENNILVDCGISLTKMKTGLRAINLEVSQIDAIFITHEHSDHISGLPGLMKECKAPVYTNASTWQAIPNKDALPRDCCRLLKHSKDIKEVKVEPFAISHDAAEPVGFNFYYGEQKASIMTDSGFAGQSIKEAIADSDLLVLEANHDINMLRRGRYPWPLKQRIMSNKGHLANTDTGWLLSKISRKNKMQVMLAHLSEENNRPEIAEKTVSEILTGQNIKVGEEINLQLTSQNTTVSWSNHIF